MTDKYKYLCDVATEDLEMKSTTFGCRYPITFETKNQKDWFIRELKKQFENFEFVDGVLYEIAPSKFRQYFWIENGELGFHAQEEDIK